MHSKIKLSEVIKINKDEDLNKLLEKYKLQIFNTQDETRGDLSKLSVYWKPLGNNYQNASTIDMLTNGEKGIIERLTNAIDAVFEKEVKQNADKTFKSVEDILNCSYPKFYNMLSKVERGEHSRLNVVDAAERVILAINDGKKSNLPSFDIIDTGIGVHGTEFENTILSLQGGNKIDSSKSYLIGSFGQGGATSMCFSKSTILISKHSGKYFMSVVKKVELEDYKNHVYLFLNYNAGSGIELLNDINSTQSNYLDVFTSSPSGTLIKMIETDINKKYRDNDISMPNKLIDYINTELFYVKFPVKIVENRGNYTMNQSHQNRYAYGSKLKLLGSKHKIDKFCGEFDYDYNGLRFKIYYYAILPEDKQEWGKDKECRKKYAEYNCHEKPIIYTVNGQYINGINFTKLKNNGLNFLQYRILVNIDLDNLGKDKYNFFTTDRSKMKETEKAKGFEDDIIRRLVNEEPLIELNRIISEMSISSEIDEEIKKEVEDAVREEYMDFINKSTFETVNRKSGKNIGGRESEVEYFDTINDLTITNSQKEYYMNSRITINVETGARKDINNKEKIDLFLNEKGIYPNPTYMNGRITYILDALKPGEYEIFASCLNSNIESNKYKFTVIDEKSKEIVKVPKNSVDIRINIVEDKDYICQVSKKDNDGHKTIYVDICFDHEILSYLFDNKTDTQVTELKNKLLKPISIFNLILDTVNDEELDIETRNKFTEANIRSVVLNGNMI